MISSVTCARRVTRSGASSPEGNFALAVHPCEFASGPVSEVPRPRSAQPGAYGVQRLHCALLGCAASFTFLWHWHEGFRQLADTKFMPAEDVSEDSTTAPLRSALNFLIAVSSLGH